MSRRSWIAGLLAAGVVLIGAGLVLPWHDVIIFPGFRALAMPLWGKAFLPPPAVGLFTYGTAALLVLGLGWVGWQMRRPAVVFWAAFFLLLLGVRGPLQIAFTESGWLEQFLLCREQYLDLTMFANQNELPNSAKAIAAAELYAVESPQERWDATLVSLRVGWCAFVAGGVLLVAGAGLALDAAAWRKQGGRMVVVGVVFAGLHLGRPMAGQYCWRAGDRAERAGDWAGAEGWYRRALWTDDWNRRVPRVYDRLGAMAGARNERDSAEYYFWRGYQASKKNDLTGAVEDLSLALAKAREPGLRAQAARQYGTVGTRLGLRLYGQGGPGAAAEVFRSAGRALPVHVSQDYLAAVCLSQSGQYAAAQELLDRAIEGGSTTYLQAHVYTARGNIKTLRNEVPEGRLDYLKSLELDDDYNMRAQKALTDNLAP